MRLHSAAGTIAIDPTLLALIPIVTALLTILAGIIGATVQSRREHKKWLRDNRLEAFTTARVYVGHLERLMNELTAMQDETGKVVENPAKGITLERAKALRAETQELIQRAPEVTVAFDLLGSGLVEDSINEVIRAVVAKDADRIKGAKLAFLRDARALLEIRTSVWAKLRRWWRRRRVQQS